MCQADGINKWQFHNRRGDKEATKWRYTEKEAGPPGYAKGHAIIGRTKRKGQKKLRVLLLYFPEIMLFWSKKSKTTSTKLLLYL